MKTRNEGEEVVPAGVVVPGDKVMDSEGAWWPVLKVARWRDGGAHITCIGGHCKLLYTNSKVKVRRVR